MWLDIGPEKRALLKGLGFDVVGMRFVRCGKTETETLSFEHVRAMPIPTLRAETGPLSQEIETSRITPRSSGPRVRARLRHDSSMAAVAVIVFLAYQQMGTTVTTLLTTVDSQL